MRRNWMRCIANPDCAVRPGASGPFLWFSVLSMPQWSGSCLRVMLKDHVAWTRPHPLHHEDVMKSYTLCAALIVFAGAVPSLHAQIITNGEIERGVRMRGPAYDGASWTARYNYGLGIAPLYINGNARG